MAAVPLSWLARWLLITGVTAVTHWDTIEGLLDSFRELGETPPDWGRYSMFKFGMRIASGDAYPEKAMYGCHWVNLTSGELDHTWTTSDFTTVENAMSFFWGAQASKLNTETRLEEVRWYRFGPGIFPPNPPVRIYAYPTPPVGAGGTAPHQVASTVTLRTALRRHWGRFYLPVSAGMFTGAGGQLTSANVDSIAGSVDTLFDTTSAAGIVPVVWDRNRRIAASVTAYEVDSIPDIIRRRRVKTPTYRNINPVPT